MTMFIILEPVPGSDHSRHRGKDVAITLHGHAINAWRDGGSQWKAWNSRLISASMDVMEELYMCCPVMILLIVPVEG